MTTARQDLFLCSLSMGWLALCFVVFPNLPVSERGSRFRIEAANVLANRDPDKTFSVYSGCLRPAGRDLPNWIARYGDNLIKIGSSDGADLYRVNRWRAVPGPDYVIQSMTLAARGGTVIDYAVEPLECSD